MALETPQSQQWSDRCLQAALAASECADWCIQNGMPADHIRLCLDASSIAAATAQVMERESPYMVKILDACTAVLDECAASCRRHKEVHDAMRRCEAACTDAADSVREVAQRMAGSGKPETRGVPEKTGATR